MKNRMFIIAVLLMSFAASAVAQSMGGKSGIEDKVALESSLEGRLKRVLTEIAGTEDIIVIVNAELAKERMKTETKKKDDDFILPGVPIREAISEKSVQSAVMSALGEDTRTLIRRLKATIIVDKGLASDTEKIIREVASGLLGIDETRGDSLLIQKMTFRKQTFTVASLFYPPNIFWLIAVMSFAAVAAAITAFLLGAGRDFTKNLVGAIQMQASAIRESGAAQNKSADEAASAVEVEALRPAEQLPTGDVGGGSAARPFSFVNAGNIDALSFIIKNETSAAAASIIGCLGPELAAMTLERMPADRRGETTALLSDIRQLAPDETERLQTEIKKKISYIAGGEKYIAAIAENLDESVRGEALKRIGAVSADKAERIRKAIVTADMLVSVDAAAIGMVVKYLGASSFAQVIRSFSDDAREKMLSSMPAGAASRIRQEMDLAKAYSPARLASEKKRLVGLLKKMKSSGLIEI